MSKHLRNIAIVLAGGIGERMRLDIPKQLLKVSGKPVIEHTVFALNESSYIDEIIIMITPGFESEIDYLKDKFKKITHITAGGETRNATSKKAIGLVKEESNLLFHDAVRPFITDDIIKRCIDALDNYNAVDTAIMSADTIIRLNDKNIITEIPDRSTLRRGQTPQAFKHSTIKKAYEIAEHDKEFKATDDCGVVLKYMPDEPVYVVDGAESNIKITHPLDATIADKLFQMYSMEEVSISQDTKASIMNDKVVVVFGSSYGIGKSILDNASRYGAKVYGFSRSETNTDVANEVDIQEALEEVFSKEGRIDYVVNTAGQLNIGPLSEMSAEDIRNSVDINYVAPILLAKHSYKYLSESKGQLLLFTSSSYTRGRSNYSTYSSSKAAVVNFTQAIAEEWYPGGVRINCINPERTATPMRVKAFGEEDQSKLLSADTVADASIDMLVSDITGQVYDVRLR
jgi:2-C-methyl-D-erythritol 4-phosphate cytidylyltransferase